MACLSFFPCKIVSLLPSPTIWKLKAQLDHNVKTPKALDLCPSYQKTEFHINPYMSDHFLKLPVCPELMEIMGSTINI